MAGVTFGMVRKWPKAIEDYLFKRTDSDSWQQISKDDAELYLLPGTRIKRVLHNKHFPNGYTQEMVVTKAPFDMWVSAFDRHLKAIEYSDQVGNRHYFIGDLFNGTVYIYRDNKDHISPELFEL